jgi:hypothetical protein
MMKSGKTIVSSNIASFSQMSFSLMIEQQFLNGDKKMKYPLHLVTTEAIMH